MDETVTPNVNSFSITTAEDIYVPDSLHWNSATELHIVKAIVGGDLETVDVAFTEFDAGLRDTHHFPTPSFDLSCTPVPFFPISITFNLVGNEIDHDVNFDRSMSEEDTIDETKWLLHLNGGNVTPDAADMQEFRSVLNYNGVEAPGTGSHLVDYDGTGPLVKTLANFPVSAFSILALAV